MTDLLAPLRYNRDVDDVARAVDRLMDGMRSGAFTEAPRFRTVLAPDGYVLVHPRGRNGEAECALVIHRDDFVRDLGAIQLSDVPIPRRNGWYNFAAAAETVDGIELMLHMPSGVEGDNGFRDDHPGQVKAYRAQIAALRQWVAEHPKLRRIRGDWNLDARLEWVRAYFARHFPDFEIVAPTTGTHHGGRVIDWALVRKGHGDWTAETVPNPASDHEAVTFTRQEAPMARTYLEEHPPRIRQYRRPRRALPSGVIVVHTAESQPDETGPDTGAENVARFIQGRTTYGSYHDLADSDSIVHLVPYDAEAYGDGTGSNPHAYHVSAATQAHRWPTLSAEWRDACVRNMARAAARYARWIREQHGVVIPARRITRAQSDDGVPGFLGHGQRDPDRRTDPGKDFPWDDFLAYYAAELDGSPTRPDPKDWFSMATKDDLTQAQLEALRTDDTVKGPRHWPADNPGTSMSAALSSAWQAALDARAEARAATAAITALAKALDTIAPNVSADVTAAVEKALAEGIELTVTTKEQA